MMLALARHIPQATQSMREGRWEKKRFMGTELYHQTLGIIGLGKIGSIVADRALGMKMEVSGYDPYILPEAAAILGVELVSLDELLGPLRFYHPAHADHHGDPPLINRDTLAKMKPGVRIINCARGGLIDEEALYEVLVSGHVAGAALDVFAPGTPVRQPASHSCDNVIFTPHLGASSVQAQANVARAIASQIPGYLQHGIIRNAVNFPSISPKDYEKIRPYLILAERLGNLQGQLSAAHPAARNRIQRCDDAGNSAPAPHPDGHQGAARPHHGRKGQPRERPAAAQGTPDRAGYLHHFRITGLHGGNHGAGEGQKAANIRLAGTVFPGEEIRLVRLNNYRLEAELEGINLLIQNLDKPGMIGFIGTTLGNFQVNIANMHLSRTPETGPGHRHHSRR